MGIINVLDTQTANLVAAGEVVERPAAAVKEMLENSADANAKSITVEIKDGGVSYIRITDDGIGMAADDVPKTILRHATSKIKTGSDLAAIYTLGFRGEALAAIAAVSRLRILTKRPEDAFGTYFQCEFGTQTALKEAGCPDGTTIIVENLFENTPARKNFLKRNLTEGSAVMAVCERFALSRPKIALTFIADNNTKLRTPGDGLLKNLLYACIGKEFVSALQRVDYNQNGIRVCGYIGAPENCRANRNLQNFFVNGRYIRSRTLTSALEEAFRGFCPVSKFPTCALYLILDPKFVDVNAHPAKLEIKFSNDPQIFDIVYFAVRGTLGSGIAQRDRSRNAQNDAFDDCVDNTGHNETLPRTEPSVSITPTPEPAADKNVRHTDDASVRCGIPFEMPPKTTYIPHGEPDSVRVPAPSDAPKPPKAPADTSVNPAPANPPANTAPADASAPPPPAPTASAAPTTAPAPHPTALTTVREVPPADEPPKADIPAEPHDTAAPKDNTPSLKINPFDVSDKTPSLSQSSFIGHGEMREPRMIGEAFDTYILVEYGTKLYFIDKHAAHERIIYERIKHASDNNDAQYLLDPVAVTLTAAEFEAVGRYPDYFTRIGFDLELFGDDTYLVRSTPTAIPPSQIKDTVTYLAGSLTEGNPRAAGDIFDRALFTAACKAAIKGGNKDTELDDKFIIREIFHNDAVLYCPHGRPILIEYTKERLEKLFGRT